MYFAHFCEQVSGVDHRLTYEEAHREDTNTFQTSDVLVQILYIRVDFMSCGNSRLKHILGRAFLEVCSI